jgi:hypothetical protein
VPPLNPVAGRLARAQANFYESFPIMAAAILIVSVAHLENRWTALGALIRLGAASSICRSTPSPSRSRARSPGSRASPGSSWCCGRRWPRRSRGGQSWVQLGNRDSHYF